MPKRKQRRQQIADDPAPLIIGWEGNALCEQVILAAPKHNYTIAKEMLGSISLTANQRLYW
jgi:hypothetical protein